MCNAVEARDGILRAGLDCDKSAIDPKWLGIRSLKFLFVLQVLTGRREDAEGEICRKCCKCRNSIGVPYKTAARMRLLRASHTLEAQKNIWESQHQLD